MHDVFFNEVIKVKFWIDLGRSLGVCVFVTNCSEQIDYKSIGNTFKGLAMRYKILFSKYDYILF